MDNETSNATAAVPFPIGTYAEDETPPPTSVIINEVDADTPGTDAAEFVEIYDGGAGNTSLDGFALVFYNGSNDLSYGSVDLDGLTIGSDGYAVVCGDVDAAFKGTVISTHRSPSKTGRTRPPFMQPMGRTSL